MGINIEIKARCDNLDVFKSKLLQLPVTFEGEDFQTDTFFIVPHGRLKLRESTLYGNILIPYLRPDQEGPKQSNYEIIPLADSQKTKLLLSSILGIKGEIIKKRQIYLYENVRVHLDEVEGLGSFIEFEAVIDDDSEIGINKEKIDWLLSYFNIGADHLVKTAYIELFGI
ncbi:MAG TPA: class IV adenylate cyclase [Caldithrix sp.]|nr:class IV adenylate cyclase [Calditrichaceae bacterium]HEM49496.1 class IV adenylate cyclase [Caldithrix sp.]